MNHFKFLYLVPFFIGSLLLAQTGHSEEGTAPEAKVAIGQGVAPAPGGTFNFNIGGEPTTINPISSTDVYASRVQGWSLESLMERDNETYEWKPLLASSYEVSKDGKTFTFTLRKGVTWHDGKPLTPEDVKFSFDVIFNDKYKTAHLRPYYEGLEKVEIQGSDKIVFKAKDKYFKNLESAALLTIVPKHLYEDPDKKGLNKTLVGTGPYILENYDKGNRIVFKKNEKWWGLSDVSQKGRYNYDKVVLRFVKEDNVSFELLKKGDIDFQEFNPEVYVKKAVGSEWGTKVIKVKTENKAPKGFGFVGWNLKKDFFNDKKVRLALAHLMNRRLMNEKFRFGMSLPATGPWYQQSEYANPNVKAIDYDQAKAIALFKEAGWTDSDKDGVLDKTVNGRKIDFRFQVLTANKDGLKYLTMYKEDARKAGVQMDIKLVEWNTFTQLIDEFNFDAVNLGWSGGSVDLDPKQIWHCASSVKGGSNFIGFCNKEVDKLIDEARQTFDKAERVKVLRRVYEIIADEAPYAFMFNEKNILYGHTARMKKAKDAYAYSVGTDHWWISK